MNTQSPQHNGELFYETLIKSYVNSPRFIERPWLAKKIETALSDPNCRFLLLTAEPGAGKTAFMAWLASQHPDWPRYFIRRDSQTPLSSGDARSFLFAIGHQMAAQRPTLFHPEKLEIVVEQRIGELRSGGKAVGITIEELLVSPFYKTSLNVKQEAKINAGDMEGLSVTKMVAEKRFLELENLQYLALFDPAQVMLKEYPDAQVIILIDALDELRYYHGQESILDWLCTCPELPSNVRFIITSRPEDMLNILKQKKHVSLKEEIIDPKSEQTQIDLRRYAENFAVQELIKQTLSSHQIVPNNFIDLAVMKADGNFQYLAAIFRGIEKSIELNEREQLEQLLRFENVPIGLGSLYSFFLTLIKNSVFNKTIEIPSENLYETRYIEAWGDLYLPILGILSVAMEPLDSRQIKGFCGFQGEDRQIYEALERLGQFLDHLDNRYRLYHNTFAEFLISPNTKTAYPNFYLDPAGLHRKIVAYYRGKFPTWDNVDWSKVDNYGLIHLATHLYALRDLKVNDIKAFRKELYGLICKSYMLEKLGRYGSQPFSADVALTIEIARSEEPSNLVQEFRGLLIYASMVSFASNVPPEALGVLASLGQVMKAKGFASQILDQRQKLDAYRLMVEALINHKEMEEAKVVIKIALGLAEASEYFKTESLRWIAQALIKTKDFEMALTVAKTLDDNLIENKILIEIANAQKKLDQAEFDETSERDVQNEMLQSEEEKKIIKQMLEQAEAIEFEDSKAAELIKLALSLVEEGRKEQAIQVANQALIVAKGIEYEEVKARLFSKVADALAKAGDNKKASEVVSWVLKLVEEIEAKYESNIADSIFKPSKSLALKLVAQALAQVDDLNRALVVAEAIRSKSRRIDTLIEIAYILAEKGEKLRATEIANKALIVAETINDSNKVNVLKSDVAYFLALSGSFNKAQEVAEKINDDYIKEAALGKITFGMSEVGEFDKAMAIANIISDNLLKVESLTFISKEMSKMGDTLRGVKAANLALVVAEAIGGIKSKAKECAWVAQALARARENERAKEVADEVLMAVESTFETWKVDALSEISQELAKAGMFNQGLAVADVIGYLFSWDEIPGNDSGRLIGFLKQKYSIDWVKTATIEKIDDGKTIRLSVEKNYLSLSLNNEKTKVNLKIDDDRTDEFIANMVNGRLNIYDIGIVGWKAMAMSMVAEEMIHAEKKVMAIEVANRAKAMGNMSDDIYSKAKVFSRIAEVLARAGEFDQALRTVEAIETEVDKVHTLMRVAHALARAGNHEKALSILNVILSKTEFTDRQVVFTALGSGASLIANMDQGQTLWKIYEVMKEVDGWWSME